MSNICQNEALHATLFNQFSLAVPLQIFELCYSFRRFHNFGRILHQTERKSLQIYRWEVVVMVLVLIMVRVMVKIMVKVMIMVMVMIMVLLMVRVLIMAMIMVKVVTVL